MTAPGWLHLGAEPDKGPWINLAHVSLIDTRLASESFPERGHAVALEVNGRLYSWGRRLNMSEANAFVVASFLRSLITRGEAGIAMLALPAPVLEALVADLG